MECSEGFFHRLWCESWQHFSIRTTQTQSWCARVTVIQGNVCDSHPLSSWCCRAKKRNWAIRVTGAVAYDATPSRGLSITKSIHPSHQLPSSLKTEISLLHHRLPCSQILFSYERQNPAHHGLFLPRLSDTSAAKQACTGNYRRGPHRHLPLRHGSVQDHPARVALHECRQLQGRHLPSLQPAWLCP